MQLLDDHLADYIRTFRGLEDTVLLFAGDHGNRMGSIVETVIGRVEERMPFVSLIVPKRLLRAAPALEDNLLANERRLTTWIDLHETFKDLLNVDKLLAQVNGRSRSHHERRGYSLWRQKVPLERTCKEAVRASDR